MTEICKCGHKERNHQWGHRLGICAYTKCKCKKFEPKNHSQQVCIKCGKTEKEHFEKSKLCDLYFPPQVFAQPKTRLEFMEMKYDDGTTYWEVWNKKNEELGFVFYNKKWKKWVWEQGMSIIMSWDCLQEVVDFMKQQEMK